MVKFYLYGFSFSISIENTTSIDFKCPLPFHVPSALNMTVSFYKLSVRDFCLITLPSPWAGSLLRLGLRPPVGSHTAGMLALLSAFLKWSPSVNFISLSLPVSFCCSHSHFGMECKNLTALVYLKMPLFCPISLIPEYTWDTRLKSIFLNVLKTCFMLFYNQYC